MSLIKIENISAGYTKENIIENISFEINESELVGILGANGSGKSTLLKAICNILPHNGNVLINDNVIENLKISRVANLISYVPQKSGIGIDISVLDVVKMGFNPQLKLFDKPSETMEEEARNIIDLLGLIDKIDANYMTLSEGQKQLTILARALVGNGIFIVMDEPESALDFNVRINTVKTIKERINSSNRAGLIILHDVMLALNNCDKLILLKDKSIAAIIDMYSDSINEMEDKLKQIYGEISLSKVKNKSGNDNFIMLFESEAT